MRDLVININEPVLKFKDSFVVEVTWMSGDADSYNTTEFSSSNKQDLMPMLRFLIDLDKKSSRQWPNVKNQWLRRMETSKDHAWSLSGSEESVVHSVKELDCGWITAIEGDLHRDQSPNDICLDWHRDVRFEDNYASLDRWVLFYYNANGVKHRCTVEEPKQPN